MVFAVGLVQVIKEVIRPARCVGLAVLKIEAAQFDTNGDEIRR